MSIRIAGMGWVTPLGTGLQEVCQKLQNGEVAEIREIAGPRRSHRCMPVPPKLTESLGRNPRLRRASPISYLTAAAGLAALENAGSVPAGARTAVLYGVASGSVVYTRKFYEQIVKQGAHAASPLLFPETVYNAPASHLAALLGIDGISYTLVGDGSVGLSALHLAEQLLLAGAADRCVVAGGEELDWILAQAYAEWRMLRTPLAEAGAALVLARDEGSIALEKVHPGVPFFRRAEAAAAIGQVHSELAKEGPVSLVVGSANGSFVDAAEAASLAKHFPGVPVFQPKRGLGEALGAGALIQVILGALALQKRGLESVLVSVLGLNQQASGVRLSPTLP